MIGRILEALESAKSCGKIHFFGIFFAIFGKVFHINFLQPLYIEFCLNIIFLYLFRMLRDMCQLFLKIPKKNPESRVKF